MPEDIRDAAQTFAAVPVAPPRGGVPWRAPVVCGNWATPADDARVRRQLANRVGPSTVVAPPEFGTLAYFCRCSIVDASADRGRGRVTPLIAQRRAAADPLTAALLTLNHARLDRDQQPRPATHQLVSEPGPATQSGHWQTWSPATGVGRRRLVEIAGGS